MPTSMSDGPVVLLLRAPQMSGSDLAWALAACVLCPLTPGYLSMGARVQEIPPGVAIIFLMQSTRCRPRREVPPDLGPDSAGPSISEREKHYRARTLPSLSLLHPSHGEPSALALL